MRKSDAKDCWKRLDYNKFAGKYKREKISEKTSFKIEAPTFENFEIAAPLQRANLSR